MRWKHTAEARPLRQGGTVKKGIRSIYSYEAPPLVGRECVPAFHAKRTPNTQRRLGKMVARALLSLVVFTCGFAADAGNQVKNGKPLCVCYKP